MLQELAVNTPTFAQDEEPGMTFQVALVGSDGVILGSDRRITNRATRVGDAVPFNQYEERTKFFKSDKESVIVSFVGGSEAQRIGREIVEKSDPALHDSGWESYLDGIAAKAQPRGPDEVLVLRKARPNEIVRCVLGSGASRIENHFCAGAIVPACFLTQHFYRKQPVALLENLAILTLKYGSEEAPTTVGGGFDIVFVTESGTRWKFYALDAPQITSLKQKFESNTLGLVC
jgi:hypothetical protein